MKPNFLIIGAARSGTTSLFKYLESHPDIFMSEIKEINFFSNEKYWQKGLDWYGQHFAKATQKCVGEASTSYTSYPFRNQTPERIFKYLPNVKLIYVIRDPIDRFLSHYLHRVSRGSESREMNDIIYNYQDDFLLTQGKYFLQLEQYLKYFSIDRIYLLSIENLKHNPSTTIKSIYDFLDIDTSISGAQNYFHHNANKKITRKNRLGQLILKFYLKNIEQVAYPYRIKKLFLRAAEIGAIEVEQQNLDEKQLIALKAYFKDDIKQLKQLYPLNLEEWRNYEV